MKPAPLGAGLHKKRRLGCGDERIAVPGESHERFGCARRFENRAAAQRGADLVRASTPSFVPRNTHEEVKGCSE